MFLHFLSNGKKHQSNRVYYFLRLFYLFSFVCISNNPFQNIFLRLTPGVNFEQTTFLLIFPRSFDMLFKLSPMKTICMKCQIPFSEKNEKNKKDISKRRLMKILP